MTADTITAIKKSLEGVTPDRLRYEADAMYAAVQGEEYGDTFHAFNWADKPHRVIYDAINLIRDSASEIDRLQRENAIMQERTADYPTISAKLHDREKAREAEQRDCREAIARASAAEAKVNRLRDNISYYRSGSFAHAVNEHLADAGVSINGDILHDCIQRSALASTGGEHHADK